MKNSNMFGALKAFADREFFDVTKHGFIYLPNETLTLEFFAYLVIGPTAKSEIYNPSPSGNYAEFIKQNARHYRDIALKDSDRVVTLSTCAYEFDGARMVLLARVT